MNGEPNFLLGYGERLTKPVIVPGGGGPKKHPYAMGEAVRRLAPRLDAAVEKVSGLPELACPQGRAVLSLVLHPSYLAKTYYPKTLLKETGLEPVGSKSRKVTPEKWAIKEPPESAVTAEIFVAGGRDRLRAWATALPGWSRSTPGADDLITLEDIEAPDPDDKVKPIHSSEDTLLLEAVLHASEAADESDYVLDGFEKYLRSLGIRVDLGRRMYAKGLCFLPVRAPRSCVGEIAKFSFLRVVRAMPHLRQVRPSTFLRAGGTAFACTLPTQPPLDPQLRAAVFDGGVGTDALSPWVKKLKTKSVGKAHPELTRHGGAVTSALLFGPMSPGRPAERPFGEVHHFRVLDENSGTDAEGDLFDVLNRIAAILERREYQFVNFSLGPDLPAEDDEVHAWTAVLDSYLADGNVFAAIAAGNTGEHDRDSGNARIQPPADCVNGVAVGACDAHSGEWNRAPYSSVGPGRTPGIIKPDLMAFGGTPNNPFWVLDPDDPSRCVPVQGTSFAAPLALRMAMGLRAHFGSTLNPLALKALLIHHCDQPGHSVQDVGWGRIPPTLDDLVVCPRGTVEVVYQGELAPSKYLRAAIPIPKDTVDGIVEIAATLCFACDVDPEHPVHYTCSGVEPHFRPHTERKKEAGKIHADTTSFFGTHRPYQSEFDLRSGAYKWETVLHAVKSMRGSSLKDPCFDLFYNARAGGQRATNARNIPYALVISLRAEKADDLYDRVLRRYPGVLVPLRPTIQIPIRTSGT